MPIDPCGPPCSVGAFDSSDPACNMPMIPKIVSRIITDCEVPKAPDSIFEVPFPDFPLPPNFGFQCTVLYPRGKEPAPYTDYDAESHFFKPGEPRVSGTPMEPKINVITGVPLNPDRGTCDLTLEVNVPCISVYPAGKETNFEDPSKESTFFLPNPAVVPTINVQLIEPENIDRSPCDFNFKVDVPCITVHPAGKEPDFEDDEEESSFFVPDGESVPRINVSLVTPENPYRSPCDYNIKVDVPCITVHPAGKEPGFEEINLESRLILPVEGRESIIDITLVAPETPNKSPCDYNIKVDVPCITVHPAGVFPDNPALKSSVVVIDDGSLEEPEIDVRIEPSDRANAGTCDFDIGVDFKLPTTLFCTDLRVGEGLVVAPAPEVCDAHPTLPFAYTQAQYENYYEELTLFAECWWKPVDIARAADDYDAFVLAFADYEAAMVGDEVYIIPDYFPTMTNAVDISRANLSSISYVDPDLLAEPHINSRIELTEDGGCSFIIATDLIMPDPCARIKSGKGDLDDPGAAPSDPGSLPPFPTLAQRTAHAEYWWHPTQVARYEHDFATFETAFAAFKANVPEPDRYLIVDYYADLDKNVSYDKPQASTVKYLPKLKEPRIATHIEKTEPTSCVFGISADLVLPCVGVDTAGSENDCPDPGEQPDDPGAAPDPITTEWRIEHAEYWWWAVAVAKFDKDEEAFNTALADYESNVVLGDRYLVSGYSIHLANSINKLACQTSTVEIIPPDEPATAFVRIEPVSEDSCDFKIGFDIRIPIPEIDVNFDGIINPTPFKGYTHDAGEEDEAKAEKGCITIQLENGRVQNFEVPASTQRVAVGEQLVVKAYIKDGAPYDEVTGYAAADIVVEYITEAADIANAWQAPVEPLPAPAAQPEVVVPTNGITKDGGYIVGFMALDSESNEIWTQVLNECIPIDGRRGKPVNFRGVLVENGGPFIPPNNNVPDITINQGAVLLTFRDGQNKPYAFKVDTPVVVVPGDMVILDIEFSDEAYVAVPDNMQPKGIRYDFDPDEVTITCTVIPLVENDDVAAVPEEVVGTVNTVGIIGIYYPINVNNWPDLQSPHWIQKFEGMFHFAVPKPILATPAPLAPGTVLTSAGVDQVPYWDYPRFI